MCFTNHCKPNRTNHSKPMPSDGQPGLLSLTHQIVTFPIFQPNPTSNPPTHPPNPPTQPTHPTPPALLEVFPVDDPHHGVLLGHHCGRAWRQVQQGQLPEAAATRLGLHQFPTVPRGEHEQEPAATSWKTATCVLNPCALEVNLAECRWVLLVRDKNLELAGLDNVEVVLSAELPLTTLQSCQKFCIPRALEGEWLRSITIVPRPDSKRLSFPKSTMELRSLASPIAPLAWKKQTREWDLSSKKTPLSNSTCGFLV